MVGVGVGYVGGEGVEGETYRYGEAVRERNTEERIIANSQLPSAILADRITYYLKKHSAPSTL